jgi:pyruvate formate lyase activating enzyme
MRIGGFQKCSLIDYPGKLSAIIFTLGCNFKCSYCHNPELVNPELFPEPIPEEDILSFLATRKGKLDALVITGGEPTLQEDLVEFALKVKELDFLVKLDTNGSNSRILEKLIGIVDYVAMDIKAPLEKYHQVSNSNIDTGEIKKSIELIMNSDRDYEFRTTVVKSELEESDILKIGKLIQGARLFVLQKYAVPEKNVQKLPAYPDDKFREFQSIVAGFVQKCTIR